MVSRFDPFTDEQMRCIVNLRQRYEVWIEAERALIGLPYDLRRKKVAGREYLYEIEDRGGNGKSLGPIDDDKEAALAGYRESKAMAKSRRVESARLLEESCRLYRALRLPLLASEAGEILREADRRDLLGGHLIVIGTNAMPAYAIEAAGFIRGAPDETQDCDLAWTATEDSGERQPVWSMLKAVDATYTVNTERSFQARNARAYEVELLVAPSRANTLAQADQPRPVPMPEQEWLLRGSLIDHIVVCRDASPARIVAPDPRWFGLHKLWLSVQPKRNPLKRAKDGKQGAALLNAVHAGMPQFPIDEAFEQGLPDELLGVYRSWKAERGPARPTPW